MIRAIAFDLDDTLYPEIEFVYSGYRAVSDKVHQQYGIDIYADLVELFNRGQRSNSFNSVLKKRIGTAPDTYILELVAVYRHHQPTINVFPETHTILDRLRCFYRLALISDGYLKTQEQKLEALTIGEYFDVVILSDIWGKEYWKPHPRPFRECADRLSVNSESLVYVGDNPHKDFRTPRELGIKTIRVRRPGTLYYNVRLSSELEADYEVESLDEILCILEPCKGGLVK